MNLKEWLKFMDEHIMLKQDARAYLEMSESAFNQSVKTGQLKPIYERGEGTRMVRFFLRSEVEEYKKRVEERRKRLP